MCHLLHLLSAKGILSAATQFENEIQNAFGLNKCAIFYMTLFVTPNNPYCTM